MRHIIVKNLLDKSGNFFIQVESPPPKSRDRA